jgi:hypothetical protein
MTRGRRHANLCNAGTDTQRVHIAVDLRERRRTREQRP